MIEVSPEHPRHIKEAVFDTSDESLMTIAVFMLAAGARLAKRIPDHELLSDEELSQLGLNEWWNIAPSRKALGQRPLFRSDDERKGISREEYYSGLYDLILSAIEHPGAGNTGLAVAKGLRSPDELIRICALVSATELFQLSAAETIQRLVSFSNRDLQPTTSHLVSLLANKTMGVSAAQAAPIPPSSGSAPVSGVQQPGLMLIHGTNAPQSRPTWSIPGTGPLFNFIQPLRSDLYGLPDYFRWEGGYSDYAREVAAQHLDDWIARRNLAGLDAITHSHGGNVLFEATWLGAKFNQLILLSCPVRWWRYQPKPGSFNFAKSLRIHCDLVLLADRAGQRFPIGHGIDDEKLPIWFVSHSDTNQPKTWRKYKLGQYL